MPVQLVEFLSRTKVPHSHNIKELLFAPSGAHLFGQRNSKSVKCFHKVAGLCRQFTGCSEDPEVVRKNDVDRDRDVLDSVRACDLARQRTRWRRNRLSA